MLYLDFARRPGEWLPNEDGGNENRDAVRFLRSVNSLVAEEHPGALMIAEDSTSWPGVCRPVAEGGLGFTCKWNLGWMNDTLGYLALDSVYRRWRHDAVTFGLIYAFSENFVLPLSHDEVVHCKRSVFGRMPGDTWRRCATLRAYYAFMWAYPGKKLLFMGQEFGQRSEWNFAGELEWSLLEDKMHAGVQACVRDLNALYRSVPALHARDCRADGFRWIVVDDSAQSVFAWQRAGAGADDSVIVVCNFTPVPRQDYQIGAPSPGRWREVLNTDSGHYGGSGMGNLGEVQALDTPSHGFPASIILTLPPLATLYLQFEPA
jgi:1,4-alpha-glucan branching enzyme